MAMRSPSTARATSSSCSSSSLVPWLILRTARPRAARRARRFDRRHRVRDHRSRLYRYGYPHHLRPRAGALIERRSRGLRRVGGPDGMEHTHAPRRCHPDPAAGVSSTIDTRGAQLAEEPSSIAPPTTRSGAARRSGGASARTPPGEAVNWPAGGAPAVQVRALSWSVRSCCRVPLCPVVDDGRDVGLVAGGSEPTLVACP